MLLCGWSIVSAQTQTPAFGYQAVVRTANNKLVTSTPVGVAITVMSGDSLLYSETQNTTTDSLGMLNLLVGKGNAVAFKKVDWSIADSIRTVISVGGEDVDFVTPLFAVPYALKADKTPLTTEQIVEYLSDPTTTIASYKEIMDSLVSNIPTDGELWDMIKGKVVNYLKERKDKAVDILAAYLEHADSMDIVQINNAVKPAVKTKIMNLSKQYALDNKGFAMDLLEAYLPAVTPEDVDEAYDAAMEAIHNNFTPADSAELQAKIIERGVSFAKNHLDLVVSAANYFLKKATSTQVEGFISAFEGSTASGMMQAFVNTLFYNYLDYYLLPQIKTKVNNDLDPLYIKNQKCGTEDVRFCDMKEVLE